MTRSTSAVSEPKSSEPSTSRFHLSKFLAFLLLLLAIGAVTAPNIIHLTWIVLALFSLATLLCLRDDLARWSGQLKAAFVLFTLGVVHAIVPTKFIIDWPGVVLFLIGISLLLFPSIERLLPFVESLEVGNTKVRLRELQHSVREAEEEELPVPSASAISSRTAASLDTDVEARVLDLAARDKYSALLRLGIEIEQELAAIQRAHGNEIPTKGISWSTTIKDLHSRGIISGAIEHACMEFRSVRNRVIHATREGPVSEQLASSAIDSGLRIYRLLKATLLSGPNS
jgi:hypothetical protein